MCEIPHVMIDKGHIAASSKCQARPSARIPLELWGDFRKRFLLHSLQPSCRLSSSSILLTAFLSACAPLSSCSRLTTDTFIVHNLHRSPPKSPAPPRGKLLFWAHDVTSSSIFSQQCLHHNLVSQVSAHYLSLIIQIRSRVRP